MLCGRVWNLRFLQDSCHEQLSGGQSDVLGVEVLFDSFAAALAAQPGLLDAAEGSRWIGNNAPVHADHPEFEGASDSGRSIEVLRVEVGSQSVVGVVCARDYFGLGVEACDDRNRTEDLFTEDACTGRYIVDDGRLVEVAGTVDGCPARAHACSGSNGFIDQCCNRVALLGIDQRTKRDVVFVTGTHCCRGDPIAQSTSELFPDRIVYEQSIGGSTGFTTVTHLGGHRTVDCGVDVGVIEDDERGIAAKFHGALQYLICGLFDDLLPDGGGSGEGDLSQSTVLHQSADDVWGIESR